MRNNLFVIILFCFPFISFGQTLLEKADKQYDLNLYSQAIKSYQKVLEKEPSNKKAVLRLADCYRISNLQTEAANWYRKAVVMESIDPLAYLNYGKVLMASGEYEKASLQFGKYAETDPKTAEQYVRHCQFALKHKDTPPAFEIVNETVNTNTPEFGVTIFNDKLVFSSFRTEPKRTGKIKRDAIGFLPNQLFQSFISGGRLEGITFHQSDISNGYNDGPIAYSKNGKWVAFVKNNYNDASRIALQTADMSLYIAEVKSTGEWSNPMPFPHNGSNFSSTFPYLNEDGSELIFASNRPDGMGGFDLYSSKRNGKGGWSFPVNLGDKINTSGNEISPYKSGNVLYFSSDYHIGFGGYDIFMAEGNDWSDITHLGTGINSAYDDFGFIFSEEINRGFFVSNRNYQNKEDIYSAVRQSLNITITCLQSDTRKPIADAKIDLSKCGESSGATDEFGRFKLTTFKEINCSVKVTKEGYLPAFVNVNVMEKNTNASYEVKLIKTGGVYVGFVKDGSNNKPLKDVIVFATASDNSDKQSSQTDDDGVYAISLAPDKVYNLKLSKAGYVEDILTVKTAFGEKQKTLESVSLLPAADLSDSKAPKKETKASKKETKPTTKAEPEVVEKSEKTTPTTKSETPKEKPIEVVADVSKEKKTPEVPKEKPVSALGKWSIQVLSLDGNSKPDLTKYANLRSLGILYSIKTDGKFRVRLGDFNDKAEADDILKKVKAKGYSTAFITTGMEKEESKVATGNNYKIRIAAVKDVKNVPKDKLEAIGKISEEKKGELTVIYVGQTNSLDEARKLKEQCSKNGFKDAYIVREDNGVFKKAE